MSTQKHVNMTKSNWIFATNSDLTLPMSLQPDDISNYEVSKCQSLKYQSFTSQRFKV